MLNVLHGGDYSTAKRIACGFSGILAGAGILIGVALVIGALFGLFWLGSLIPAFIWKGLGYVLASAIVLGIAVLLVRAVINAPATWRDFQESRERARLRAEAEAARRAKLPPVPPAPKVPLAERLRNFAEGFLEVCAAIRVNLGSFWREIKDDMRTLELPKANKVAMVATVVAAEFGLLYGLAYLDQISFVPSEKITQPAPIIALMFAGAILQIMFTAATVSLWYKLDHRHLPTLGQRVLAAGAAVMIPLYAASACEYLMMGMGTPTWVSHIYGVLGGGAVMAFVLGFTYTCEKNIFEMLKGDGSDDGLAKT